MGATADDQEACRYSTGHGYFSDAYKLFDNRPRRRNSETASLRWNHHIATFGATLRANYRFYQDTYGINSHTIEVQWVQPVGQSWVLTPGLRYFTQNAQQVVGMASISQPQVARFPLPLPPLLRVALVRADARTQAVSSSTPTHEEPRTRHAVRGSSRRVRFTFRAAGF